MPWKPRASADWGEASGVFQPDELKIAVLGAAGVGKTAIVNQYLHRTFIEKYRPTVEDFSWIEYETEKGRSLVVKIVDHSGSNEFPAMLDLYIKTANGFILVSALDTKESVRQVGQLIERIKSNNTKSASMVLVVNKLDLLDQNQSGGNPDLTPGVVPPLSRDTSLQSTLTSVSHLAETEDLKCILVSAKNNLNISEVFTFIVESQITVLQIEHMQLKKRRQSLPHHKPPRRGSMPEPDREERSHSCTVS